ncbi:hypothetical protein [Desulfurispirillum indicum]|uniref:hypothetical protein n=1 Tax=Desulfurispirillum indicum TaxID=936456 RepID=UPI00059F5154|nr:hypothetical protein [Desulfurispirillum indicum]
MRLFSSLSRVNGLAQANPQHQERQHIAINAKKHPNLAGYDKAILPGEAASLQFSDFPGLLQRIEVIPQIMDFFDNELAIDAVESVKILDRLFGVFRTYP